MTEEEIGGHAVEAAAEGREFNFENVQDEVLNSLEWARSLGNERMDLHSPDERLRYDEIGGDKTLEHEVRTASGKEITRMFTRSNGEFWLEKRLEAGDSHRALRVRGSEGSLDGEMAFYDTAGEPTADPKDLNGEQVKKIVNAVVGHMDTQLERCEEINGSALDAQIDEILGSDLAGD